MSGFNLYQNNDGADQQSQAVLAYLRYGADGVEESYDAELRRYMAEPKVARWDNGREQGYVVFLKSKGYARQINVAFFEHRNSDSIHALVFEKTTFNAPTLADIPEGVYVDKWSTTFSVSVGEAYKMAEFITQALVDFWKASA